MTSSDMLLGQVNRHINMKFFHAICAALIVFKVFLQHALSESLWQTVRPDEGQHYADRQGTTKGKEL